MDYADFLATKRATAAPVGFEPRVRLSPHLFGYQRDIVLWALRRGRAALFADCGLGKTPMELEWALHVAAHTARPVLILTPLAVAQQFVREGAKFGIAVHAVKRRSDVPPGPGIYVTNYEKLAHFDASAFGGIVLDESSILKAFDGSTRKAVTEFARAIPFRLAGTATPAPNDLEELANHSEFLDILSRKEILACFFTQDGNSTAKWRLKGHAVDPFWRWMASWSVALRRPSDLGYSDEGFVLPELRVHQITVRSAPQPGYLFPTQAGSLQERRQARRSSLSERVQVTADLVNAEADEPWVVWRKLLDESAGLKAAIPGSMELRGADDEDSRAAKLEAFTDGRLRVLITDPTIAGFGLNWQHCCKMAFVGLDDSYEAQYQAIRRCWRFGQTRPVDVHLVCSEAEGSVLDNLKRKERQSAEMFDQIVRHMAGLSLGKASRDEDEYRPGVEMNLPGWLRSEVACG